MIFGLFLLGVIVAIYLLFVRGWLFKLMFFFCGWFGMYVALSVWIPDSRHVAFTTSGGIGFTWAFVIPTIMAVLVLLTTKE
jgi:hypothetical protein